jgi:nicotinamidase-related amidase
MEGMTPPWLAVIDMQHIFRSPDSAWAAPGFDDVVGPVNRLVEAAGERVTFTRFVAPAGPAGAWIPYYELWPFALQSADAPIYQLVDGLQHGGRPTLDATTFGKWSPALAGSVGEGGHLVLAGVSTDCCVMSTAVAAADAGVFVQVVSDACAGLNATTHQQALNTLSLYGPLIEIVTVERVVASWA